MSLSAFKLKKLTAAIGTCLVLGASGPMLAQTDLVVENDGLMLSAFVGSSSDDILSTSIRIVGPNGFTVEKRIEGGSIDWIPDSGLQDGIYHWEAWTVSAKPGAEIRDFSHPAEQRGMDEATIQHRIDNKPLERLFRGEDKNVTTESGSFRVRNGWLESAEDGEPFSAIRNKGTPNAAQRLIGRLLDAVVPSAHAQETNSNIVIKKISPALIFDSDASPDDQNWRILGNTNNWTFRDMVNSNNVISISPGSNNANALQISGSGNIGFGTSTPSEARLHIRDTRPQIRLEDPGEDQSWFIKAANQGAFEIGERWFNSETISSHSAFRIYPETPEGAMQIQRFQSCTIVPDPSGGFNTICGEPRGRVGLNTEPSADLHIRSTVGAFSGTDATIRLERSSGTAMQISGGVSLGVGRAGGNTRVFSVNGAAPNDSLSVASDGNVGVGTASPDAALHVRRTDNSAEIRVEDTGTSDQIQFRVINEGPARFRMENNAAGGSTWTFSNFSSGFAINRAGTGTTEMLLRNNGDLQIRGTLTELSSRSVKHGILPVDGATVLGKLSKLNISEWRYDNTPKARHIGPMAEDWHDLFGLGSSNKRISPRDLAGVSLAAAQALYTQNNIKQERIDQLATRNQELESRLERLEAIILLSDIELAGKP